MVLVLSFIFDKLVYLLKLELMNINVVLIRKKKDNSNYAKHLKPEYHIFNEDFVLLHNEKKSKKLHLYKAVVLCRVSNNTI